MIQPTRRANAIGLTWLGDVVVLSAGMIRLVDDQNASAYALLGWRRPFATQSIIGCDHSVIPPSCDLCYAESVRCTITTEFARPPSIVAIDAAFVFSRSFTIAARRANEHPPSCIFYDIHSVRMTAPALAGAVVVGAIGHVPQPMLQWPCRTVWSRAAIPTEQPDDD